MVIDHVGVVVRSIESGIEDWIRLFGYRQATEIVVNTRQKVRVVFLEKEGSLQVKLIEATEEATPVAAFARRGGGFHHLCFRVDDLGRGLAELAAAGARVIVPPQPGEAFDGEDIAFVFASQGLNVEVIATTKRAKRI
jgi:methylmalonyl-CoA/ethylmalonyl-CoA epimerase